MAQKNKMGGFYGKVYFFSEDKMIIVIAVKHSNKNRADVSSSGSMNCSVGMFLNI